MAWLSMKDKPRVENHKDYANSKEAYNCVIPYGDWEGGGVIIWDLKKKVELKQGQALFFRGRVIVHNA